MNRISFLVVFIVLFGCVGKKSEQNVIKNKSVLLTQIELSDKSLPELRILRNEIFARHGYIFKSEDLLEYFSQFEWYDPLYEDVNDKLNNVEKENIKLILETERYLKESSFSDKVVGQWTSKKYLESLKETKSQRSSQSASIISFVDLKKNNESLIVFNFHEGITPNYITENDKVVFPNEYMKNDFMQLIDHQTLVYHNNQGIDTLKRFQVLDSLRNNIAINEILFQGNFLNVKTNETVRINKNGTLKGLHGYDRFKVFEDYMEPAMDLDLIRLKGENDTILAWQFNADTLCLFSYKCVEFDSIDNFCVSIGNSELVFKLLKLN